MSETLAQDLMSISAAAKRIGVRVATVKALCEVAGLCIRLPGTKRPLVRLSQVEEAIIAQQDSMRKTHPRAGRLHPLVRC